MKKILLMFIAFISLFGIAFKVQASEVKCVYYDQADEEDLFTIEIKDNKLSVSTTKKENEMTGIKFNLDEGDLRQSHFINGEKYYCRDEIYYRMEERTGENGEPGETIILQANKGGIGQLKLDKSKSTVKNDEVVETLP